MQLCSTRRIISNWIELKKSYFLKLSLSALLKFSKFTNIYLNYLKLHLKLCLLYIQASIQALRKHRLKLFKGFNWSLFETSLKVEIKASHKLGFVNAKASLGVAINKQFLHHHRDWFGRRWKSFSMQGFDLRANRSCFEVQILTFPEEKFSLAKVKIEAMQSYSNLSKKLCNLHKISTIIFFAFLN